MKAEWGKRAIKQFRAAVLFIKMESYQGAEKFRLGILGQIDKATKHPENYGPDKQKRMNDGSYRYFTKYSYRVSYRVMPNGITYGTKANHSKELQLLIHSLSDNFWTNSPIN